jgi:simple sugar transport system permease protein
MKRRFEWEAIVRSKIFWAVIAELAILLVSVILRPDFLKVVINPTTGMFYGVPIDILNRSAEITIIAMGMPLVIALGGTDLSVGALVAVSGAMALKFCAGMCWNTPRPATIP